MFFVANIIYIIICFIYCIEEPCIRKKERRYTIFFLILVFAFLMAFRPIVTKDTINYIHFYENIDENQRYPFHLLQKYKQMEYGFLYLNLFLKKINLGYRFLFFLISFFNVGISIRCLVKIKEYVSLRNNSKEDLYGSTLVGYMAYLGVLYNGVALRGGISISFSLLAVCFFLKKKHLWAFIYGIMAFLFQRTCFILFIAVLLVKFISIRNKKQCVIIWWIQGVLLITNIGSYFIESIAEFAGRIFSQLGISGFSGYLQSFDVSVGKIDWLIWILIGVCVLYYQNNLFYKFFIRIVLLGGWIIVFLHGVRAINRMYDYFIIFALPLLSARYDQLPYRGLSKTRVVFLSTMFVICIMSLRLAFF